MAFIIRYKGLPIRYSDWKEWRAEFIQETKEELHLPEVDLGEFCAICWGTGLIYEQLSKDSWVGIVCKNCSGIGRTWK